MGIHWGRGPMGSQGGTYGIPRWAVGDPWALGTRALRTQWPLGIHWPLGTWALGDPGPWGPIVIGPWGPRGTGAVGPAYFICGSILVKNKLIK